MFNNFLLTFPRPGQHVSADLIPSNSFMVSKKKTDSTMFSRFSWVYVFFFLRLRYHLFLKRHIPFPFWGCDIRKTINLATFQGPHLYQANLKTMDQ